MKRVQMCVTCSARSPPNGGKIPRGDHRYGKEERS